MHAGRHCHNHVVNPARNTCNVKHAFTQTTQRAPHAKFWGASPLRSGTSGGRQTLQAASCDAGPVLQHEGFTRRCSLSLTAALVAGLVAPHQSDAVETSGIEILWDAPGSGTKVAKAGTLLLFHYVGTLADGTVFDSTRGGQAYRDGGPGKLRPLAVQVGGGPRPGVCAGLLQGLEGMTVGGRRSISVPPALGFGGASVLAPYAYVPPNSTLKYDIELLRLSTKGPDELFRGVARCGTGGMSETADNCGKIDYLEI